MYCQNREKKQQFYLFEVYKERQSLSIRYKRIFQGVSKWRVFCKNQDESKWWMVKFEVHSGKVITK